MNFGDYKNPTTQPGRLYAILLDMQPHDAFSLAVELRSICLSTVVSALRIGLDADGADLRVPECEPVLCGDGVVRRFYRLAPRGEFVDVPLFSRETVAA